MYQDTIAKVMVKIAPEDIKVAVDETVMLLHPPSPFSRCINSDGEGISAK